MKSSFGCRVGRASRLAALAAVVFVLTLASNVWAHAVGLSRGRYVVEGTDLVASVTLARGELAGIVRTLDTNHDGVVTVDEITAARPQIAALIVARIVVRVGTQVCPGTLVDTALTEEDGATIVARYRCPPSIVPRHDATIELPILDDMAPGHRHLAHVEGPSGAFDFVAFQGNSLLPFALDAHAPPPARRPTWMAMLRLGVEHILTGWDHLLFLFALVLVGGRPRALLGVVTAFTVAHSITLAVSALGVWAPSPRVIEPAIALSIAYVGVENFFVDNADKRWRITFPFGLIHGFGFAGALREIALPRADIPAALLFFNLGVEVGQLGVLALVVPLLAIARRRGWLSIRGVHVLSAGVIAVGLALFIERIVVPPT